MTFNVTTPDPITALRRFLLDQTDLADLTEDRIYAYEIPRATVDGGLDRTILLVQPSGRSPSVGDYSRALIGRPRFDTLSYGGNFDEAARVHWAAYALFKALFRAVVTLGAGDALIHDVVVEGGPLHLRDPDSDAPVVVGVYSADVAEEFLSPAS